MTNTLDKYADVLDVRDLISRLEELEDQITPRYVAGWNMPGYLPESEPAEFGDEDEAMEYIKEAARDAADAQADGMGWSDDDLEEAKEEIDGWDTDRNGEFGQTFGAFHYWISKDGEMGLDADDMAELTQLREVLEELCGNGGDEQWRGDWYPVTLIRDSYFEDYCQELAEDCGYLSDQGKRGSNPLLNYIDWQAWARDCKIDYSSIDIDDVTYWYR